MEKTRLSSNPRILESKVLTVYEVADYLHCHISTIYRLLYKNDIPAFKIGSDWRFNIEHIDQWRLARQKYVTLEPLQSVKEKP